MYKIQDIQDACIKKQKNRAVYNMNSYIDNPEKILNQNNRQEYPLSKQLIRFS